MISGPVTQAVGNAIGLGNAAQAASAVTKWPLTLVFVMLWWHFFTTPPAMCSSPRFAELRAYSGGRDRGIGATSVRFGFCAGISAGISAAAQHPSGIVPAGVCSVLTRRCGRYHDPARAAVNFGIDTTASTMGYQKRPAVSDAVSERNVTYVPRTVVPRRCCGVQLSYFPCRRSCRVGGIGGDASTSTGIRRARCLGSPP